MMNLPFDHNDNRYVKKVDGKRFRSTRGCTKGEAVKQFNAWHKRTFGTAEKAHQKAVDDALVEAITKHPPVESMDDLPSFRC